MRRDVLRPKGWLIALLLALPLLWYTFMVALPVFTAAKNSLYNWSGGAKKDFVGLFNYQYLLKDKIFWQAFTNNLKITVISAIGQIGLAFVLSSLLSTRFVKLKGLHRTVAYFPATISAIVVGYVWSFIFGYDTGLINSTLRALGLDSLTAAWLDNPKTIINVVCIPIIWQYIGYYMIIILAGITSIDQSVYEMAELDGANGFQRAIKITLPLIRRTLGVCVMLCISGNMKIFDHIYSLTNGGPGNSSIVMAMHAYRTTFVKSRFGYASAISIAILIISLTLILGVRLIVTRPWKKEDA